MKKGLFYITSCILILSTSCTQQQQSQSSKETQNAVSKTGDKKAITMDGELPDRSSLPAVFDEMDYQQATQTYLWALPLVSFAEWQYVQEQYGATNNDLVMYDTYMNKLAIVTANATTPYVMALMDLSKTGPMVIEMPAGHTAGGLADFWQRELAAIGEVGADKGKGGKYLLIPPGHEAINAPGYYTIKCNMMNIFFGFRALDPDPKAAEELIRSVKLYSYEDRNNPPPTKVVSPNGNRMTANPKDGMAYWERLHKIIQNEPVQERDRFFMAWLHNLGISKGEPFQPTARQKKILLEGASQGKMMAYANSFDKRFKNNKHWPDKNWDYVMVMTNSAQRAENYDEFYRRTSYFFEAVTFSKAMITKVPNVGQAYLGSYTDSDGEWFDGEESYTLNVPANPPALNFWSLTVYDGNTRCLIQNEQKNADLSSRKDLIKNEDGSVDLYFGPTAPEGKEQNWVQTIPGKHWFAYMRFYAPTEAYFDKSWKMDDINKMKN
ncbi:DUF1254 domain-containing protein [Tamlana sp. 2_MG-2023]|uniref:DUF1254 domain-containing protein n=1 Tax=unclassified Tamlana TaxID=2614803 RepID=UPI0026E3B791|nr:MULTISPECIES: DUF1254 domain-containing protein [unclassified Tamlana]MDO6760401.1 DUF1254 domain-containing protein [Tamlana sp. 2_MG-2023]MDO6789900.1 DUF1254 domain-containing protein [Tamlana sp. 1_MG-2023]